MAAKLNVNIDHVATIREARKTIEPSIVTAAVICEQAGANGITVHLRGDRRHIDTDRRDRNKREARTAPKHTDAVQDVAPHVSSALSS